MKPFVFDGCFFFVFHHNPQHGPLLRSVYSFIAYDVNNRKQARQSGFSTPQPVPCGKALIRRVASMTTTKTTTLAPMGLFDRDLIASV